MKLLLDECVPRKLKLYLSGHTCSTVVEAGFRGIKNGELLRRAETAGFEVLITLDKGIEFEQNFKGRRIAVLIIRVRANRLTSVLPMVPMCLGVLAEIRCGEVVRVGN